MGFIFLILFWSSEIFSKIPDKPHGELPSDYFQFWFLYESEKRPGQNYEIYRPFFSIYQEHETAYKQRTVLFPLYYKEETNYWYTWSVMFLFTGTGFKHEDTGDDEDLLTPFLLWGGGDTEEDRYWGLFPFYGQLKGKLGYKEVNFVLFPIYSNWQRRDYKAHGVLWPIVMWGGSETRSDVRAFPFFAKKEHKGKYYQYSVLWPFFQWGRKYMDKREPISYGMFFPFYLYKDSDEGNMKSRGLFWFPFLGSFLGAGYDKRTSEVDFNLLFFLVQYGRNNDMDYRKLIFFPFYGQYQFASKKSTFISPFYFRMTTDTHHVQSHYTFILPFFSQMDQYYPELDRYDEYWKLWPLIRYHRDTEGSIEWNAFTLFPLRSQEIEKTWDPLISFIEYKSLSNGEKRFSLLMRLYTQRWSHNKFAFYIPLLTDYESHKDDKEWKFFYGLLGYKKQDDKRSFQLFWLLNI
ncbi:MAG: hypothetical protein JJT78_07780 [Leptospira sp.]|nr:hypothetical protein [Leptospira sp.]